MWLDHILLPSGSVICIGAMAIRLFVTGASAMRKCPVAPELDIPIVGRAFVGFISCVLQAMCGGIVVGMCSSEGGRF